MKLIIQGNFALPIGLLLLSAGFVVKQFLPIPDFVDGFFKGAGISIILLSLMSKRFES